MGVFYNPIMITDGLVLSIDGGNTKSYTGSGSIWNDLSASKNNVALFNSPGYSSANNGYLTFSSTSLQYATATSPGNLSRWTIEALVRFTGPYTKAAMIIGGQYDLATNINFTMGTNNAPNNYNIAVGFFNGAWRSTTGIAYAQNTWFFISGTYDGSVVRQFTNGSQVDSLNYVGTPVSGGEVRINRRWDDTVISNNIFDTNIAKIHLYNRALSEDEIKQNFNAIRGRFGI